MDTQVYLGISGALMSFEQPTDLRCPHTNTPNNLSTWATLPSDIHPISLPETCTMHVYIMYVWGLYAAVSHQQVGWSVNMILMSTTTFDATKLDVGVIYLKICMSAAQSMEGMIRNPQSILTVRMRKTAFETSSVDAPIAPHLQTRSPLQIPPCCLCIAAWQDYLAFIARGNLQVECAFHLKQAHSQTEA